MIDKIWKALDSVTDLGDAAYRNHWLYYIGGGLVVFLIWYLFF